MRDRQDAGQRLHPPLQAAETTLKYDKRRYKRRNRIKIMFGRLEEGRRVASRHDRCPKASLLAGALAAVVIYWLLILALAANF